MTIYESIALNIKYYMNKLENSIEFKNECPNATVFEYITEKTEISSKRLNNILNGKARTRIDELYLITKTLGVKIDDILSKEIKQIES